MCKRGVFKTLAAADQAGIPHNRDISVLDAEIVTTQAVDLPVARTLGAFVNHYSTNLTRAGRHRLAAGGAYRHRYGLFFPPEETIQYSHDLLH